MIDRFLRFLGRLRGSWLALRHALKGRILFHPAARLFVSPSARMEVQGELIFGFPKSWSAIRSATKRSELSLAPDSHLSIKGSVHIAQGATFVVRKGARVMIEGPVTLGPNFSAIVSKELSIAAGCSFGSDVTILDGDLHAIRSTSGERTNPNQPIRLAPHVWVGQGVRLLKGASLGEGSIVAAGSVVFGAFGPRSLVFGNPATLKRELTTTWEVIPDTMTQESYFFPDGRQR